MYNITGKDRDNAREESNELKNKMSFPAVIEGDNLLEFVNINSTLYEGVNNTSYKLTTNNQNCNLMLEFKNYHAKSFAIQDWKLVVYRPEGSNFHIAIINIKEQVFAKTFSLLPSDSIDNVLSLNGYRISFSIDDVDGYKSSQDTLLFLNIHNSPMVGNCQSFLSNAQKSSREKRYKQPCSYCDNMKDPTKSNIDIRQSLVDESRQQENIENIAKHVSPENRSSTLCLASLLGLNEALTKKLLLREAYDHRSLMMNMFERTALRIYFDRLISKHTRTTDTTSKLYELLSHQIMVAKRG